MLDGQLMDFQLVNNAHPHTDCKKRIAVVHNGIIENYKELKDTLQDEGHIFTSETDTEVVAHLIEKYMEMGNGLEAATRLATKDIQGSYAIAAISADEPNKIIGVRKESPLIVGVGETESFHCIGRSSNIKTHQEGYLPQ